MNELDNIEYQVCDLINKQNKLTKLLNPYEINLDDYVLEIQENIVIACAKITKLRWYVVEIAHVSVLQIYHKHGYGTKIVERAEEEAFKRWNICNFMSTIVKANTASIALFKKRGFSFIKEYRNQTTGNVVGIYMK